MTTLLTERSRVSTGRAPASDPPFDDERAPELWAAAGAQPPLQLPEGARDPQRAVAGRARSEPETPPLTNPSPETRAATVQFLKTCLEVLNGYRPVAHLRAMSSPLDAAAIQQAMTAATRRLTREAGGAASTRVSRVRLQRMRICEPRAGVAEISAVLGTGPDHRHPARCWAAALRLENGPAGWRCTVARLL